MFSYWKNQYCQNDHTTQESMQSLFKLLMVFFFEDLSSASEGYKWRIGFRKTEVKGEMRVISKVLRHLKSKEMYALIHLVMKDGRVE